MNASRMAKRHPKPPFEELQVTNAQMVEFALMLRTEPEFCLNVVKTVETLRHNEAIAAVWKKRQAWHPIRKWLHRKALDIQSLTRRSK